MINKQKLYSIALISTAMLLMLMSIAGAAPFAYITNGNGNNVSVINTATNNVTATVPVGEFPIAFGKFIGERTPVMQSAALTITRSPNPLTYSASGQTITQTYTVKNTGDVRLTDVVVSDSILGPITLLSTNLGPGDQTTGTATYKTKPTDLSTGSVSNTATVYNGTQQLNH